jgi:SAM-dependent methyltransferase
MNILRKIAEKLQVDSYLDDSSAHLTIDRIEAHSKQLNQKEGFIGVAHDIQNDLIRLLPQRALGADGVALEIGSGVLPLNAFHPNVFSSDVVEASHLDLRFDALEMPFADSSCDAVIAQNVFHHLESPMRFLDNCLRILKPGGSVLLVEPSSSWLARLVFPFLFASESYKTKVSEQELPHNDVSYPNQALSYLYFVKNRSLVFSQFSQISEIEITSLSSGLRYLLSGGLNFRPLVPKHILRLIRLLDQSRMGRRIFRRLSLHWIIVISTTSH